MYKYFYTHVRNLKNKASELVCLVLNDGIDITDISETCERRIINVMLWYKLTEMIE